jgi:excisionase family DNA binding protein
MIHEPLICKDELAQRLRVSISCVDRWIRSRRIPVYRLAPKCVRFDYSEVRRALARCEVAAFRRFPREVYKSRKRHTRQPRTIQLALPLNQGDPDQAVFPFFEAPAKKSILLS